MKAGADVEAQDEQGATALIVAAKGGHNNVVVELLNAGADVEAQDEGGATALIVAAKAGHDRVISILLNRGANVEACNKDGTTALMMALKEGHDRIVDRLSFRADVGRQDLKGRTALMMAAERGFHRSVKALLRSGADVNTSCFDSETALILASRRGNQDIVQTLLLHNATTDDRTSKSTMTALMYAAQADHDMCIRTLLLLGASTDTVTDYGHTALVYAAANGNADSAAMLLAGGALTHHLPPELMAECEQLLTARDTVESLNVFGSSTETCGKIIQNVRRAVNAAVGPGTQSSKSDVDSSETTRPEHPIKMVSIRLRTQTRPIGDATLTITGNSFAAYATPARDYVNEIWKETGLLVFDAFLDIVNGGAREILDVCELKAESFDRGGSGGEKGCEIIAARMHNQATAILVGQILVWLAATLRSSSEYTLSLCDTRITTDGSLIHIETEEQQPVVTDTVNSCWHPLFPGFIIATGFPVRIPKLLGLDVPFEVMLHTTRMLYATNLAAIPQSDIEATSLSDGSDADDNDGGLGDDAPSTRYHGIFFTGVNSLLYPLQSRNQNGRTLLRWHYQRARASLFPPEGQWHQIVEMDSIKNAICFLGYTPHAEFHLGTESRKEAYDRMHCTKASHRKGHTEVSLKNFGLGVGSIGGHGMAQATLELTYPMFSPLSQDLQSAVYDDVLDAAANEPVILYNTTEGSEGGWFVPQLCVILDLMHFRAKQKGWVLPHYASSETDGAAAARIVFLKPDFANQFLYNRLHDESNYTAKHLAVDIWTEMTKRKQYDQASQKRGSWSFVREKLYGWDLLELTEPLKGSRCRQFPVHVNKDPLVTTYPSWLRLTRDYTVYFCDDLGKVILSKNKLCKTWARRQKDRQSLVVSLNVLTPLFASHECECCYHLCNGLIWEHRNGRLFQPCNRRSPCLDNKVQTLRKEHGNDRPDKAHSRAPLVDAGAVMFGEARTKAIELDQKLEDIGSRFRLSIQSEPELHAKHEQRHRNAATGCYKGMNDIGSAHDPDQGHF